MKIGLVQQILAADAPIKAAFITACAAFLASIISLFNNPAKYWFDNLALRAKLRTEYKYKNLTNLQDLIGRYKGLLIEAAESLNLRFWNFYRHENDLWLRVDGDFSNAEYYFRSWVKRLVRVLAIATAFGNEAIYIDQSIASKIDFEFIYMLKIWAYMLSNLNLFDHIPHEQDRQRDHLFADTVRCIGEAAWKDHAFVSNSEFDELLKHDDDVRSLCRFLDGVNSTEQRLRWDRLVCLHVAIIIFLNTFGYSVHFTDEKKLTHVINKIKSRQIRRNLLDALVRWHLTDSKGGKMAGDIIKQEFKPA